MKEKIKQLILKAYGNAWFNAGSVMLAFVLGLTQSWPGIVFLFLYLVGMVVYVNNMYKPVPAVGKRNKK